MSRRFGASRLSDALPFFFTIAVVIAIFGRTVSFELLDWDDQLNIRENPTVSEPSLAGLGRIWTQPYAAMFIPVVYSTFLLDQVLGRGNPAAFHFTNLAIHCATACLVYLLLLKMTRDRDEPSYDSKLPWLSIVALMGATLFALHPLQVESVAWVTGRKDLLMGFFSMVYLLVLARWVDNPKLPLVLIANLALLLALLSKPTAVILPILGIAVLRWRRVPARNTAILLLPGVLLAAGIAILTYKLQQNQAEQVQLGLWRRPFLAADSILFYLRHIIVPTHLVPIYPRTIRSVFSSPAAWLYLPLCLVGGTAAFLSRRALWLPFVFFLVPLLPVAGLVPMQYQLISTVADRFMYLPMLGVSLAFADVLTNSNFAAKHKRATIVAIAAMLLLLATLSYKQASHWRNSRTLWQHELTIYPASAHALTNLATNYAEAGDQQTAKALLTRAIAAEPNFAEAYSNFLVIAQMEHQMDQTANIANRIVKQFADRRAKSETMLVALGRANAALDLPDEATTAFRAALNENPQNVNTWIELAAALSSSGHSAKAHKALESAAALNPHDELVQRLLHQVDSGEGALKLY